MLQIIHLLAGTSAFVAAFIALFLGQNINPLYHPDLVYLAFCGLINLFLATTLPSGTKHIHALLSAALIVSATVLQALIALIPVPLIDGQPAIAIVLGILVAALSIQLIRALPLPKIPRKKRGASETGTVKWFNSAKGFGFIERDSGAEDIFVHFRAIRGQGHRALREGQRVRFTVTEHDKGLQAEDVALLN